MEGSGISVDEYLAELARLVGGPKGRSSWPKEADKLLILLWPRGYSIEQVILAIKEKCSIEVTPVAIRSKVARFGIRRGEIADHLLETLK